MTEQELRATSWVQDATGVRRESWKGNRSSVMLIELDVVLLDDKWGAFVSGSLIGRYPTAYAAKAAARRRCPAGTGRLEWAHLSEYHWMAYA